MHMSALIFIRRLFCICLACMSMVLPARAEWAELMKDDDITYVWDKDSVRAIHITRIAWTMTNTTAKGVKAPNGEEYQSSQARWRINCTTDSFVKLS